MRTAPKHTPGPWYYERDTPWEGGAVMSETGKDYIARPYEYFDDDVEIAANGMLIAAAPEMLEALKDCRDLIENMPVEELLMQVEAAIAKAEGRYRP